MKRLFKYALLVCSFTLLSAFVYYISKQKQIAKTVEALPKNDARFSTHLPTPADFINFQGDPLSSKYNEVLSIKVVWDKQSDKVFFLNSRFYNYHFNFCSEVLGFAEGLEVFNSLNYTENYGQRYFLANLNFYKSQNKYALEFTSGTTYEAKSLDSFFQKIQMNSFIKERLYILVSTSYLMNLAENKALKTPLLFPDEVYKNQQFQLLRRGETYGFLRAVSNLDQLKDTATTKDIFIFKGTPFRIPLCAGLITETFQTPLSHIQILAKNRGIPSAVVKQIWTSEFPTALINKPVKLSITETGYQLEECSLDDLNAFHKNQPIAKSIKLICNKQRQNLIELQDLRMVAVDAIGTKAAALGELQFLNKKAKGKWKVPEGLFAIPFYYYVEHIQHKEISLALVHLANSKEPTAVKESLQKVREAILNTPISVQLLKQVEDKIMSNGVGDSYRFRSSSNAEDLDGFSGAGLYASKTGKLNNPKKSIEDAIKNVWASVWSEAAYYERAYKNIDQQTVAMAIICHRNFPEEIANGVAITKNMYRPSFSGFTVNVQAGEVSVVNPPEGVICEQFVLIDQSLVNPLDRNIGADYISASSLNNGKRILSQNQLELLYKALKTTKEHFYYKTQLGDRSYIDFEDYALDIEFKFEQNGELYLKQVRYYPE